MEWVSVLKDYVPLFQTIVWVFLIILAFRVFYRPLSNILGSINKRIEEGGGFKASAGNASLELPEFVHDLPKVEPADPKVTIAGERKLIPSWTEKRNEIYLRNRDFFLVHVLELSKHPHQKFDIFIFLVRHEGVLKHEGIDFSIEIDYAEFFLGKTWGNRVFKVQNEGKPIGLSTSAYGTFLAICRVVFKDGYEVILERYIDFEMGKQVVKS